MHEACGMPRDEAFDDDNADAYEVVDGEKVCHACGAWERWRKESADADREPGAVAYLRHSRDGHDGPAVSQADLLAAYRRG